MSRRHIILCALLALTALTQTLVGPTLSPESAAASTPS